MFRQEKFFASVDQRKLELMISADLSDFKFLQASFASNKSKLDQNQLIPRLHIATLLLSSKCPVIFHVFASLLHLYRLPKHRRKTVASMRAPSFAALLRRNPWGRTARPRPCTSPGSRVPSRRRRLGLVDTR